MLDEYVWTRVYNLLPDYISIPRSLDDVLVADRQEVEELFYLYWAPDSARTYFPFLIEEPCQLMFRVFNSRFEGSSIDIDDPNDNHPVIKGMVMAIAALCSRFRSNHSADKYFVFAERIIKRLPVLSNFDYVFPTTVLVGLSSYREVLNSLGLLCFV